MLMSERKTKDLITVLGIYLLAFGIGALFARGIYDVILRVFVFDIAATIVTYIFSVALRNSSVYDPYWSVLPMLVSVYLFSLTGAWSVWHVVFLVVFNIWGLRLTLNWVMNFTGFDYEDWRYRDFRAGNSPAMWQIINFFGIHLVPTLVVFAGMLPLFSLAANDLGPLSLIGSALVLSGVALEFFADRQMRSFLRDSKERKTCRTGLWKYSRHPNYLGENLVWIGTFTAMVFYDPCHWYYGIGVVLMLSLFLFISIPMMEKRQLGRRPDYAEYKRTTSAFLLLPHPHNHPTSYTANK